MRSQIWGIIPQIFYDIIARIIPGFLVLITFLVWILVRSEVPIEDYLGIIEGSGIYKVLNLLISKSLISGSLILLIIIVLVYFLSIILSSIWDIIQGIICLLVNHCNKDSNSVESSNSIESSNYRGIFKELATKSRRFFAPGIMNFKNKDIDVVLYPKIVKLSAEVKGSETIIMSSTIILLIEMVILLRSGDEQNILQIFSNFISSPIFLSFSAIIFVFFIFRSNVIYYRNELLEMLENNQLRNSDNRQS